MAKQLGHPGGFGGLAGLRYGGAPRVLADGRSLHPLERLGLLSGGGFPSVGVPSLPAPGHAPAAGGGPGSLFQPAVLAPRPIDPTGFL